jgi:hypothetical protein
MLSDVGVAGLVVELGTHIAEVPPRIGRRADQVNLPGLRVAIACWPPLTTTGDTPIGDLLGRSRAGVGHPHVSARTGAVSSIHLIRSARTAGGRNR